MPVPQVQVTCLDCEAVLHGRGWPRCGECRQRLKALRKAVFRQFEEMGRPGDWASFFALATGRPMPAEPKFTESLESAPWPFDTNGLDHPAGIWDNA